MSWVLIIMVGSIAGSGIAWVLTHSVSWFIGGAFVGGVLCGLANWIADRAIGPQDGAE